MEIEGMIIMTVTVMIRWKDELGYFCAVRVAIA